MRKLAIPVEPRDSSVMWIEPSPGHTPGHVMLNLASGFARGLMTGDVIHHPLQLLRPEWSCRACEDPEQSARTRQAMLARVADTGTLLCPAHFASPSMGHVPGRPGGGYDYRFVGE